MANHTDVLRDLRRRSPEIEAVAIISVEGVMLDSCHEADASPDHLAQMSAALLGFGDRITRELGRGGLDHAVLRGQSGFVVLLSLDEIRVLMALLRDEAVLGLALLDLRRAKSDLAALHVEESEMEAAS